MISLREFAYEIRQRIDEGRITEAIPLAQYLLRRHPRYLRGYQLLAEAALEQGNLTDSIEIFSRVLSADPESFAAHAGLASAYTEQKSLDDALWHMTRAFESEPGMKAVRDQMRYLYELRDGRAPGRLHLNAAALARSYLRNGAHDAAIEELHRDLNSDPERVDLQVALIEAYWFANQPQEAAHLALQVLEELPLALKPHLFLANFYYHAGELEQAETHVRISQELDPENDIAIALFGEGVPFRAIAIPIDEPDSLTKGTAPLGGENQLPEWLRDLALFSAAEAPTDGVDWDAIIAYEDDWRTQLAGATRDELTAYKPNWRANLRLATIRGLRERGLEYPSAAPVAPPATTPTDTPPPLETVEPSVTLDLANDDWRGSLYEESISAIDDLDLALAPMVTGVEDDDPTPEQSPEWHAILRFATEEALANTHPNGVNGSVATNDPVIDLPELVLPPADSAVWVHNLRAASDAFTSDDDDRETEEMLADAMADIDDLFTATEQMPIDPIVALAPVPVPEPFVDTSDALAPRQPLRGRWIPTLRVATEIWVAMQRRTSKPRGTGMLTLPTTPDPVTDAPLPYTGTEPIAETYDTPPNIAEPIAETYDTPPDVAEPIAETYDTPPDVAEPIVETYDTPPLFDTDEATLSDPVPQTPLEMAEAQWQQGQIREAVTQYQMLFYEEGVPDSDLSAALAAWIATDSAPALVYQLLGDVYRRMGRMPEAVAHYREAINRM